MKRKMYRKLFPILCASIMTATVFANTGFAGDLSSLSPDEIANSPGASDTDTTVIDSVNWTKDTKLTFTDGTNTYVVCMVDDKLSICTVNEDGSINKSSALEDSDRDEVETVIMQVFMFLTEELKWAHLL